MTDRLHPIYARMPAEGVQGVGNDGPAADGPELFRPAGACAEPSSGGDNDGSWARRHGTLGTDRGNLVQAVVLSRPAINMMWRTEIMILASCGWLPNFCCGALASAAEMAKV